MAFYRDRIYPFLVDRMGDPPPIREIRRRLIPQASGVVLEIGMGSGANLPFYDPARVTKLFALEPNPGMVRRARPKAQGTGMEIEFIDLPGERVPLPDQTIDTAVSTFTLCTIDRIDSAIAELQRVLRPGGRLLFFELGRSPEPNVQRWQNRIEPLVERLYAGLRLTRHIPSLLAAGGFEIEAIEEGYLAEAPKTMTYSWWGAAVTKGAEFEGGRHVARIRKLDV